MYSLGRGVPNDDRKAAYWYRKAAKQGHTWGQANLGYFYQIGRGVLQDRVMAYVMYNLSATRGHSLGHEIRDKARAQLNASEL